MVVIWCLLIIVMSLLKVCCRDGTKNKNFIELFHFSNACLKGIEFYRMGQTGRLARYPVHWHHRLDAPGQYVKRCSIHQSFSRAVTVHDTHQLLVENNAAFDCCGHNFYLEDGTEVANVFKHNLAIGARAQGWGKRANGYKAGPNWPEGLKLDAHDTEPSGFWIT